MQTVLDDAETWFLHGIVYQEDLQIIVAEGFQSDETEDLIIGQTNLGPAHSIDVRSDSRKIALRFERFVAWQIVDESFTTYDEYESDDDGFFRILERSRYLDYVSKHHGWFRETVGPAKHDRSWTKNELVHVVAFNDPVIEKWTGPHCRTA